MLAVVDPEAVVFERPGHTAEPPAPFEKGHARPVARAIQGGGQPSQTGAEHLDPPARRDRGSHAAPRVKARAATTAFCQGGSATRRSSTEAGSRSMASSNLR